MLWHDIVDLGELLLDLGLHPDQEEAVQGGKISIAQGKMMKALCQCAPEGVMVKELAKALRLTPGAVSQSLDVLVAEGLAIREVSEKDRRAVLVRLSEKGLAVKQWHDKRSAMILERMLQKVSPADQGVFARVVASALAEGTALRDELRNTPFPEGSDK